MAKQTKVDDGMDCVEVPTEEATRVVNEEGRPKAVQSDEPVSTDSKAVMEVDQRRFIRVFKLANAKDRKAYETLLEDNANGVVRPFHEHLEFEPKTAQWMVLVRYGVEVSMPKAARLRRNRDRMAARLKQK